MTLISLTVPSAESQTRFFLFVKEWQERPLEETYAVVFMDAIHYHVRNEDRIEKRAVYIAIGIDMEGHKDVLGMYSGKTKVRNSGFPS